MTTPMETTQAAPALERAALPIPLERAELDAITDGAPLTGLAYALAAAAGYDGPPDDEDDDDDEDEDDDEDDDDEDA